MQRIRIIKISVSSVLNREKITFELLICQKMNVIFGFCIKMSINGCFIINKFRMPPNGKGPVNI